MRRLDVLSQGSGVIEQVSDILVPQKFKREIIDSHQEEFKWRRRRTKKLGDPKSDSEILLSILSDGPRMMTHTTRSFD